MNIYKNTGTMPRDRQPMSATKLLWFSRPAKTGATSLDVLLQHARQPHRTKSTCKGLAWGAHIDDMPPTPGYERAGVLREPAERFASAYGNAVLQLHLSRSEPTSDKPCARHYRMPPFLRQLEGLAETGTPLKFAQLLAADARARELWLTPPPGVSGRNESSSTIACAVDCGAMCGFVPQAEYASRYDHVSCLPCIGSDVQRTLDAVLPGCTVVEANVCANTHPNATDGGGSDSGPRLLAGTRDASEDARLRAHVATLYPRDVHLWAKECGKLRCNRGACRV